MDTILLIDGRNIAYRAAFAAKSGRNPFVSWISMVQSWIDGFRASAVHVFFDSPKETLWRRSISADYKDGRSDMPEDIAAAIDKIEVIATDILPYMNTYVYRRDGQEADDLIYSACKIMLPNKMVVISSDGDLIQLPWLMANIKCYDPNKRQCMDVPDYSPILQKALAGCSTDNVHNYRGIGPVKSIELIRDPKALSEFLVARGEKEFRRNLALVDLTLNPHRLGNELYILKTMAVAPTFDGAAIQRKIIEHKIAGMNAEYGRIVAPFKGLGVSKITVSE